MNRHIGRALPEGSLESRIHAADLGAHPLFRAGDPVIVLYEGRYDGLHGCFVGLREDPNWADIAEPNGVVSGHPVQWLRHPEDRKAHPLRFL
jgi:hypothetical protein